MFKHQDLQMFGLYFNKYGNLFVVVKSTDVGIKIKRKELTKIFMMISN